MRESFKSSPAILYSGETMKTEYWVLGGLALLALIFFEKKNQTNVTTLPGGLTLTSPAGSTAATVETAIGDAANIASGIGGLFGNNSSSSSQPDQQSIDAYNSGFFG